MRPLRCADRTRGILQALHPDADVGDAEFSDLPWSFCSKDTGSDTQFSLVFFLFL